MKQSKTIIIFNTPPEELFKQYFDYLANSGIPERVLAAEAEERAKQQEKSKPTTPTTG
ncbi:MULTISPECIES: hypothetical protein [Aneurinibacillus]|uniref:Uncharacterized protein n=1 Tax=Aneurinibacillus thermoaerophilus TaxID=143495 RepID=A0ABX8YF91_ANETH|nr:MULTISPECIES: hypothetical protein [Aneurinibacillus]MED0677189.1 hypothetical protein [Aneurinibacillus thermoaerophilus]MED0678280.1 hypothetical protein [Aneurinibacillus thermoaerophilus]MED0736194.1 hypothetical protein [Aneurinibacillus thermoaerophilus]MED0758823.1 hypothetical protein [Aneurinibacillus thermoaerophilus]MED0760500.1 hypothetical protein [Aneurinibacillus thermoaerophilus]